MRCIYRAYRHWRILHTSAALRSRPFTVRLLYAESLSVQYGGEVLVVHGTHARRNKKTGKVDTNVKFTHPAKDGRKSAGLKKVTVVRARYINAWEPVT